MKIEEVRPLQEAQMELLIETDRICSELNLTYYLIGGTLLGAIRHGGFIPWDIDADIAMPRADYEKFRAYWAKTKSDRYFYQHYTTEKNHDAPHAILKIRGTRVNFKNADKAYEKQCEGIYMDIFPLDQAPESPKKQLKQQKKIKFISRLMEGKRAHDYKTGKLRFLVKKLLKVMLKPVSYSALAKKMDKYMVMHNGECDKYLVSMASHYSYKKQLMPAKIYGTPQRINYEGVMLCAPAEIDDYLTRIYGDYMKLPPEEGRYELLDYVDSVDYGN